MRFSWVVVSCIVPREKIDLSMQHKTQPPSADLPLAHLGTETRRKFFVFGIPFAFLMVLGLSTHFLLRGVVFIPLVSLGYGVGLLLTLWSASRRGHSTAHNRAVVALLFLLLSTPLLSPTMPRCFTLLFYGFPLVALFLMGFAEGLLWSAALFGELCITLLWPTLAWGPRFFPSFSLRFLSSFFLVIAFSACGQKFREYFYQELIRRNQDLEAALERVKTLSGLIPICATCKSIRDDDGYWTNLKHYLESHTDLQISYGLCDACAQKEAQEQAQEGCHG